MAELPGLDSPLVPNTAVIDSHLQNPFETHPENAFL